MLRDLVGARYVMELVMLDFEPRTIMIDTNFEIVPVGAFENFNNWINSILSCRITGKSLSLDTGIHTVKCGHEFGSLKEREKLVMAHLNRLCGWQFKMTCRKYM
ncbi:24077_t:CDS:2 [Cetraspora pellucida]|uniref:24077_t:CDS:1 n=1 Tax=Cetraspora pellucida TaxID=1433469 RepID=A0A9N9FHF5_9GLOM|nr:24077_t:CDS:2 [Cetraspora pellucida]